MGLKEKLDASLADKKLAEETERLQQEEAEAVVLRQQIAELTELKKNLEEQLQTLEASYETGGAKLGKVKQSKKAIEDVYNKPEYKEVIGSQTKDEFIQANEEEEEVKKHRASGKDLKSEVNKIGQIKTSLTETVGKLNWRGGTDKESRKIPRQESFKKVKAKIAEIGTEITTKERQTPEGRKAYLEQKKQEIIKNHSYYHDSDPYSPGSIDKRFDIGFHDKAWKESEELGADFVKTTLVNYGQELAHKEADKKRESLGLGKVKEFMDFNQNYDSELSAARAEVDKLAQEGDAVAKLLAEKLNQNPAALKAFEKHGTYGKDTSEVANKKVSNALNLLESDVFNRYNAFSGSIKESVGENIRKSFEHLTDYKNPAKFIENIRHSQNTGESDIFNPRYIAGVVNQVRLAFNELKQVIEDNPIRLVDKGTEKYNMRDSIFTSYGGSPYQKAVRELKKDRYFTVDEKVAEFLRPSYRKFSDLVSYYNIEEKKIVERETKEKEYLKVKIDSEHLRQSIDNTPRDVVTGSEDFVTLKTRSQELSDSFSKYESVLDKYKNELVQVNYEKDKQSRLQLNIEAPRVRDEMYAKRKEVDNLKKQFDDVEVDIRNKTYEDKGFMKRKAKKIEADLAELNKNKTDAQNKLAIAQANLEKAKQNYYEAVVGNLRNIFEGKKDNYDEEGRYYKVFAEQFTSKEPVQLGVVLEIAKKTLADNLNKKLAPEIEAKYQEYQTQKAEYEILNKTCRELAKQLRI
ncbi:MAG: hypothetical protein HY973_01290 [Candidatus Kerfeldbacteria bacterium]|nr:hypothetical protein [Candidatus Kerfeldbacteria bacterium]